MGNHCHYKNCLSLKSQLFEVPIRIQIMVCFFVNRALNFSNNLKEKGKIVFFVSLGLNCPYKNIVKQKGKKKENMKSVYNGS